MKTPLSRSVLDIRKLIYVKLLSKSTPPLKNAIPLWTTPWRLTKKAKCMFFFFFNSDLHSMFVYGNIFFLLLFLSWRKLIQNLFTSYEIYLGFDALKSKKFLEGIVELLLYPWAWPTQFINTANPNELLFCCKKN